MATTKKTPSTPTKRKSPRVRETPGEFTPRTGPDGCRGRTGDELKKHRVEINAFWRKQVDAGRSVEVGAGEWNCIDPQTWSFEAAKQKEPRTDPAELPSEVPGYELLSRVQQVVELRYDKKTKRYCAQVWVKEVLSMNPEGAP